MKRDEIVCNCMGVTAGEIQDAIEGGASTVEEVQEATGAGTVCGGCLEEIQKMVEELA
ncbi:MAG: (2Fe-2S)-binding protein [Lachnospiraceae bacterium]|jgi:bacterioferritin-associated ferredoxin|nr:(2Fe-2S)-binding protein [Lachnospiraceae bacterium]